MSKALELTFEIDKSSNSLDAWTREAWQPTLSPQGKKKSVLLPKLMPHAHLFLGFSSLPRVSAVSADITDNM